MTFARFDEVFAAVDERRDDAVRMLQDLVRVPSLTGNEGAVQERVAGLFRERGWAVDVWDTSYDVIEPYLEHVGQQDSYERRPNVVGVLPGHGAGRSILLNAHVDTVDPGDPSLWSVDPFSGEIIGNRLYGRGSCDMKGGLVTHVIALDALAAAGVRLSGDARVAATVGEENGGFGALGAILRGHRADAALITEPSNLALIAAHGGSLVFRLTVPGRSAHGAMRDEGVSAVEKFIPLFQDLLAYEAERNQTLSHPLYDHLANKIPISVGVVRAGEWPSTVPESLVAEGRIGMIPGEDMHEFQEQVRQRVMAAADRDPWLREHPPVLEWVSGQFAPSETPVEHDLSQSVLRAHQRVTGERAPVEGATYGADMRLFRLIGEMPCVIYGAGDVAVAHQHDEHISIPDLITATKTVAAFLVDWCGVAE